MTKIVELNDRRQFRILLNPVRQDILHLLRRTGRPMTASAVADRMMLSPTAAHEHLRKLVELGVAERAAVSGSPAAHYRLADVEIHLNLGRMDEYRGEREALAAQLVDGTFRRVLHTAEAGGVKGEADCQLFKFGALHLKPEERAELAGLIDSYLRTHGTSKPGAENWEYVLMAYRADDR